MPFEVQFWRDSDISLNASDEVFRAAIMLAWASWHQIPAASLPNDDSLLIVIAGMGRKAPMEDWERIKSDVLKDWVLCSDNRYYHPRIAQRALAAWAGRTRYRKTKDDGLIAKPATQRVRKIRHEHKVIRQALKKYYGIQLAYNAQIELVRETLNKVRIEKPDTAAAERPLTEETIATFEEAPEGLSSPETVTHYSGVTGLPEIEITGLQDKGRVRGIGIVETPPPYLLHDNDDHPGSDSHENLLGDESLDEDSLDGDGTGGSQEQELILVPPPSAPEKADRRKQKRRAITCPVEHLIRLYEANMPENPRVRVITKSRRRGLTEVWQGAAEIPGAPFHCYQTADAGLEAWRMFFQTCSTSPFLTGNIPAREDGKEPWRADIDWFAKMDNIAKCLENKYHR